MEVEVFLKHLAWAGPLSVLALALALKAIRTRLFPKRPQPPAETTQAPPEPAQAPPEPTQAPPGPTQAREATPPTYDEQVRAYNSRSDDIKLDVSRAYQEALRLVVEENQPTLLTIYLPGEVKEGQPLYKIEPYPLDDHRRGKNDTGDLVIADHRSLENEDWGGKFVPRPLREKHEARQRLRDQCLAVSGLRAVDPGREDITVRRYESDSPALEAKIKSFEAYRADLTRRADDAFQEELAKVRADAEDKARNLFARTEARTKEFQQEALERRVPVEQVVDEFVALVVKQADDAARDTYSRQSHPGLLDALTPERVKGGTMFEHGPSL